jgi:hypothetical protein
MDPYDTKETMRERIALGVFNPFEAAKKLAWINERIALEQARLEKKKSDLEDEVAKVNQLRQQPGYGRINVVLKHEFTASDETSLQDLEQIRQKLLSDIELGEKFELERLASERQDLERRVERKRSESNQMMIGFAIMAVLGAAIIYFLFIR